MSAVHELPQTAGKRLMPYALRPMEEGDLWQAAEMERDAFPTLFPPTSFRRELKNRLARYLVAWQREDVVESVAELPHPTAVQNPQPHAAGFGRILNGARNFWNRRQTMWQPGQQYLIGFVGTWYMVDEAHIVSVGVRTDFRSRGIGELLLIGAIEQARKRRMKSVTLEVRTSNHIAQNLYAKYGFRNVGVRKAYYTDNHEDALIMTLHGIQQQPFAGRFDALVREHEERWGYSDRRVV